MIGCLIAGGLAVFAVSRVLRCRAFHRYGGPWCHRPGGGWHHRWHRGWDAGGPWPTRRGGFGEAPVDPTDPPDPTDPTAWGNPMFEDDDAGFDRWDTGPGRWPDLQHWGRRLFVRRVIQHVRATPEQQQRIRSAVSEFRDEVSKLGKGELRRSRQELADALRRPTFDGVVLGEQFARHDTVLEGARKALVGLVAKIHDTLEPEQRARLASLLERGGRAGWWARPL